jgi:hypothetical protein
LTPAIQVGTSALISSDWYDGPHRHFEAVVYDDCTHSLVHYYNQQNGTGWHRGAVITSSATGPGSLVQSDWGAYYWDGHWHGNYEVLVPVANGHGGSDLAHYYYDGYNWHFATIVATNVAGPASFIQSDYYAYNAWDGRWHGRFDAVVFEQGRVLVHYYNRNDGSGWYRGEVISWAAAGQGSIIQSDWYNNGHRNFEVVVPEWAFYWSNLTHYYSSGSGWYQDPQFAAISNTVPASFIQSDWGGYYGDGHWHGNFEVLASHDNLVEHVSRYQWDEWIHLYFAFGSGPGVPSFIQSDYYDYNGGDGRWHGHLEALIPVGNELWHYVYDYTHLPTAWYAATRIATTCSAGPSEGSESGPRSGPAAPFALEARVGGIVAAKDRHSPLPSASMGALPQSHAGTNSEAFIWFSAPGSAASSPQMPPTRTEGVHVVAVAPVLPATLPPAETGVRGPVVIDWSGPGDESVGRRLSLGPTERSWPEQLGGFQSVDLALPTTDLFENPAFLDGLWFPHGPC